VKLSSLLFLALALFVAACGDDDDSTAEEASKTDSTASPGTPDDQETAAPDQAQSLPTPDDVSAHLNHLALDIGERPAGSEAEQEAADYLQSQMEAFGYTVEQQEFAISSAINDFSTVEAEGQQYAAYAAQGSGTGEVEGPLVFAGLGNSAEMPREAAGALVVVQRGDIPSSQKVSNAQAAGARAVIIYNNEPGYFLASLGSERAMIPVVVVSGLDGGALKDAAEAGESGRVSATVHEATDSQNVIGRAGDGPCRFVVGGHYDTVSAVQGALDNAAGTAAVLEVAQSLAARGLTDGVCVVGFGSEEIGLLGSIHFVEQLDDEARDALVAMFNLDAVAFGEDLEVAGTRSLADAVLQVAAAQGVELERGELPPGASSDHAPFIQEDLPAVAIFSAETGPIHTLQDTTELVDIETVTRAVLLTLTTIEALLEEA
jgi:aminopeptidase YwaD